MEAGVPEGTNFFGTGGFNSRSGSDVYAVGADGAGIGKIWGCKGTRTICSQESIPEAPGFIDIMIKELAGPYYWALAPGEYGTMLSNRLPKKVNLVGPRFLLNF